MSSETALATRPVATMVETMPTAAEWQTMREMAKVLTGTGFLPSSVKTAEQCLAIMCKGRELRIPPMYALSNIVVINGKPTAGAELMLALIYRDHGDNAIQFVEASATRAVIAYRRRAWAEARTYEYTIDDAKRAGLLGNQTWTKYPAAMLRARCISAVARLAFPESIGGMYAPEEMGAAVTVNADGEIVVVEGEVVQATPEPVSSAMRERYDVLREIARRINLDPKPLPDGAPEPLAAKWITLLETKVHAEQDEVWAGLLETAATSAVAVATTSDQFDAADVDARAVMLAELRNALEAF